MSSPKYPHLFSPLTIGNATAANRILQTAHVKLFTHNGIDSQRNIDYQVARARGGAGLLITGNRLVHPTSTTGMPRFSWAFLKGAVELNQRLTAAVHEHGALMFEQLNHFGGNASSDSADDLRVLWGPSNVKSPSYGEMPKAMEQRDIDEVIAWWAHCAELSREGGFDGTEVHIGHSYLLHQFLSPSTTSGTTGMAARSRIGWRFASEVIVGWVRESRRHGLGRRGARHLSPLLQLPRWDSTSTTHRGKTGEAAGGEPGSFDFINVTACGLITTSHKAISAL